MRIITTRRRASLASIALAACTALALVACGATTDATTSADATSKASAPSESYMISKTVLDAEDEVMERTASYDEQGKQLQERLAQGSAYLISTDVSDWDEYGHFLAGKGALEEDGTSTPITIVTEPKTNEDGTLAGVTITCTYEKESFEEGEVASYTIERTYHYGDDAQVLSKLESKATYLDDKGATISTDTQTSEYDESGLETRFSHEVAYTSGEKSTTSGDISWTKDADGTPTSFEIALSLDDEEPASLTADVEVDGSGLVSKVSNMKADGKEIDVTATIERTKIDNPLPNAYEGWKSVDITDLLMI